MLFIVILIGLLIASFVYMFVLGRDFIFFITGLFVFAWSFGELYCSIGYKVGNNNLTAYIFVMLSFLLVPFVIKVLHNHFQ